MRDGRARLDGRLHGLPHRRRAALPQPRRRRAPGEHGPVPGGGSAAAGVLGINGRNATLHAALEPAPALPPRRRQARDEAALRGGGHSCAEAARDGAPPLRAAAASSPSSRRMRLVRAEARCAAPWATASWSSLGRRGDRFLRSGGREISRDAFAVPRGGHHLGPLLPRRPERRGDGGGAPRSPPRARRALHRRRAGRARDRLSWLPGDVDDAAPHDAVGRAGEPPPGRDRRRHRPRDRPHHRRRPPRPEGHREPGHGRLGDRLPDPRLGPRARDRGARHRPDAASATSAPTPCSTHSGAR